MGRRHWVWLGICAFLLGTGFGETAWAVSGQHPGFAWPAWGRAAFWAAGGGLGLAWAAFQSASWKVGFSWDFLSGWRLGAASLWPCLAGWLWPLVAGLPLPPPHDFPLRKLEIFLAFQAVTCLCGAGALGLLGLWRTKAFLKWSSGSFGLRLAGLCFMAYLLSGAWVGQWNVTGDAPHYILMADSLVHDHDVDLANNYANRDWLRFYDRDLEPQVPDQPDGRQVPEHKPGLPLLIAPGYYFLGFSGVLWTLGLLAALGGTLFFLFCRKVGYDPGQAFLGWCLFCFTAPWWVNSELAMPEMAGGLAFLVFWAGWVDLLPAWAGAAGCASLAWLDLHFYPAALALLAVDVWRRRRLGLKGSAVSVLVVAASFAAALVYNHSLFGSYNPVESYRQRGMDMAFLEKAGTMFGHSLGMLLDQEYGWFPFVPVFYLSFLGAWSWWRRDKAFFWGLVAPSLVYLLPVLAFFGWYSGMAPNRYLVCLTPAFALFSLEAWRAWKHRFFFNLLAVLSWLWAFCFTVVPWFCWSKAEGENWILRIAGRCLHLDLAAWFPSYMVHRPADTAWVAALLVAAVVSVRKLGAPAA